MEPETQRRHPPGTSSRRRAADILKRWILMRAANLVADLSEETREEILGLIGRRTRPRKSRKLMTYAEDTAGGIMTTEYAGPFPPP